MTRTARSEGRRPIREPAPEARFGVGVSTLRPAFESPPRRILTAVRAPRPRVLPHDSADMITRRQHYVWRKYLEPWTTNRGKARQLWYLRREADRPIVTDIKNVAVERDFYRLLDLQDGDSDFVRSLAFSPNTNAKLRELNEGWISRFKYFSRYCERRGLIPRRIRLYWRRSMCR